MFEPADATVIVIDDDAGVRESMEVLLGSARYRCVSYGSAEAYLAEVSPPMPSCLLLDLHLPGMSGLDLQRRLSSCLPGLPILFLSSTASAAETEQALNAGALAFLRKPANTELVLRQTEIGLRRSVGEA
jgi:FixJ family two-component response regulator